MRRKEVDVDIFIMVDSLKRNTVKVTNSDIIKYKIRINKFTQYYRVAVDSGRSLM